MFQIFKIEQRASERVSPAGSCTLKLPDMNPCAGYETSCTPKKATNNGLLHKAIPQSQIKIKI
jgi:hypothetical protein